MIDSLQQREQALTVSLLTKVIQELIENEFGSVRVVGEISNYKLHSSGHRYFTLKDSTAQLKCVMWRSRTPSIEPFDGMRVYANGRLSLYPAQGVYQLDCWSLQVAGTGDLFVAFERLKKELDAEGYFRNERKKHLPSLPQKVAIVTSATGAALSDMVSTIERRFPAIEIILRPTIVQGDAAPNDIADAIREVHLLKPDVIIVGRGGGSIEDLWAFNTRVVADAIYQRTIPLISAVGHETDTTIADFVADARAATPTAAAELCTPYRREDLLYTLDLLTDTLTTQIQNHIADAHIVVDDFLHDMITRRLRSVIQQQYRAMTMDVQSMTSCIQSRITMARTSVEALEEMLGTLHPLAPLNRGFALLERNGKLLRSNDILETNDVIHVRREHSQHIAQILE